MKHLEFNGLIKKNYKKESDRTKSCVTRIQRCQKKQAEEIMLIQQIQAQLAVPKAEKYKFDDLQEKCNHLKEEMKNKDKKLKEDEVQVKKQDISLQELQTKIDAETLIN